ncbi:MAG: RNA polymerase sigma factor RpoD/SigA [Erysipelotrichaceae bacterium]|nr:RNA polymerase sigma factor RpoD/SigA [Erysipelotrichaceae bacterium]
MNKYEAAQQALLLIRRSKGSVSEEDIYATVEAYQLSEKQADDFLVWLLQNDLITETSDHDYRGNDYQGVYFSELAQYPVLSAEEEKFLAEKVKKGDRIAKDAMIKSNLRLVVALASHYQGQLPLNDLIQEGNIGLLKAVNRFDPEKNVRFASYAQYWIRQAMSRAISQNHVIHLPINLSDTIRRLRRCERELEQQLEREANDREIAEAMDLTEREVQQLRSYTFDAVSVDGQLKDAENLTLAEVLPSQHDLSDDIDKQILKEQLQIALNTLEPREREIIVLRYGIEGHDSHTLQQIADKYSITKERVRQIIDQALSHLKVSGINLADFRVK